MDRYDYKSAVYDDVKFYIDTEIDLNEWRGKRDELEKELNKDLWGEDSVTGNNSNSYTYDREKAEKNICGNLELLGEALEEMCDGVLRLQEGAEACDVAIRCYLLPNVISDVLDDLEANGEFDGYDEAQE